MNNAKLTIENSIEEPEIDLSPELRRQQENLVELIEALSHIANSNYWKVLYKAFEGELSTLRSRLEKEKDTTEIFRLQGSIEQAKKYNLDERLTKKRQELERIRKALNGK